MSSSRVLLLLAYVAFVSLGLPDGVLGVAWPSVRDAFAVRQGALGAVSLALGAGYVLSSFLAGRLVGAFGVGTVLAVSAGAACAGVAVHGSAPVWGVFVAGAVLVGLGSGAVDAGLNAVAARSFSAKHVTWLHACYSLGATLGPLLMAAAIHRARSWRAGYNGLALLLLVLALLFVATRRRWGGPAAGPRGPSGGTAEALRHPAARLQLAAFFVYTGLEALLGQWAYTVLTELRRVQPVQATAWVAAYFGALAAGRVLSGFVVARRGTDRTVRQATFAALIGAALFAFGPSDLLRGMGLALAGLGLAPVFPCLMSRTPARLGDGLAPHAIGHQVSLATVGAALLPALGGLLGEAFGLGAVAAEAVGLSLLLVALHEAILARDRASGVAPA